MAYYGYHKSLPQIKCCAYECSVDSEVCVKCRLSISFCDLYDRNGDVKFQSNGKPFYYWRLIGTSAYLDEWEDKSKRPRQE